MAEREGDSVDKLFRRSVRRSRQSIVRSRMHSRNYDLNKAAELQYGKLPQLEERVEGRGGEGKERRSEHLFMRALPKMRSQGSSPAGRASRLQNSTESERNKTLHLDDELHKRVVGQDEAVDEGYRRDHPFQGRDQGSDKADWFLPVSRTYRCRQDRACKEHLRQVCLMMRTIWSGSI